MNTHSSPFTTSRRQFLSTLATLGGALSPLGQCLGAATRQSEKLAEAGQSPMRLVFFLQGNGFVPSEIQPAGIERPPQPTHLEDRPLSSHALPTAIEPLAPFIDRLTMIHGLSSRVTGPGTHSADFGALGCYPQRKHAFDETIDGALAKALPGIFPHVGLGVSEWPDASVIYNVSAAGPGKVLPTQCQPLLAYQRLFASNTQGKGGGDARLAFDAKTNVLDFLAGDVRRLKSRLNSAERDKLDYYLHALQSMSSRQAALAAAGQRIQQQGHLPDSQNFPNGAGGFAHLDAQFSIAASSLIAGLTNVVTVSSGSGQEFMGIKLDGADLGFAPGAINLHGVGHGTSFCGQTADTLHAAIHKRHAQSLADFLRQLDAVPEGDGSMLDNTLVVYISDQAEGHHPKCYEWPVLLIGDLGGRLRTGNRYLRYPWYQQTGHRTLANFYTTLLHAVGVPRDHFGLADTRLTDFDQNGPLAELLV